MIIFQLCQIYKNAKTQLTWVANEQQFKVGHKILAMDFAHLLLPDILGNGAFSHIYEILASYFVCFQYQDWLQNFS